MTISSPALCTSRAVPVLYFKPRARHRNFSWWQIAVPTMRFSVPQGTCLALCSLALLMPRCYSADVVDLSAADAAASPTATRPGSTANPVLLSAMGHPEGTSSLSARADHGVRRYPSQPEVGESIGRRAGRRLRRGIRRGIPRGGGLTTFGGFKMSYGFQGNHEERLGESGDVLSRDAVSLPALISFHSPGPSLTRVSCVGVPG